MLFLFYQISRIGSRIVHQGEDYSAILNIIIIFCFLVDLIYKDQSIGSSSFELTLFTFGIA